MQHLEKPSIGNSLDKERFIKRASGQIPDSNLEDDYLIYTMVSNEAEARLHEVVLCFYRNFGFLPLDVAGFVQLLVACKGLGETVCSVSNNAGYDCTLPKEINRFSVRSDSIYRDLARAIESLEGSELRYRYVTEALAIMYGNLIRYYGAADESEKFIGLLSRPNLYDQLYVD
jgi:hypothetical protein